MDHGETRPAGRDVTCNWTHCFTAATAFANTRNSTPLESRIAVASPSDVCFVAWIEPSPCGSSCRMSPSHSVLSRSKITSVGRRLIDRDGRALRPGRQDRGELNGLTGLTRGGGWIVRHRGLFFLLVTMSVVGAGHASGVVIPVVVPDEDSGRWARHTQHCRKSAAGPVCSNVHAVHVQLPNSLPLGRCARAWAWCMAKAATGQVDRTS